MTAGHRMTPYLSNPVAAWATRDAFPMGFNAKTETQEDTGRVALVATDNWQGILYIDFYLDWDAAVIEDETVSKRRRRITVTKSRWADVFGHGRFADYWYFDLDLKGLTELAGTVTEVVVTTKDGERHSLVALDKISPRKVVVNRNPVIQRLKASYASDPNADIVYVSGDLTATALRIGDRMRSRYQRWVADPNEPVPTWTLLNTTNFEPFQSFEGIKVITDGRLRSSYANHMNHEWSSVTFLNKDSTAPWEAYKAPHISFVGVKVDGGHRGPTFSRIGTQDIIMHAFDASNGGNFSNGSYKNALIERCQVRNATGPEYSPGTHSGGIHPFGKKSVKNCNWIAAERRLVGGFSNVGDWSDTDDVWVPSAGKTFRAVSLDADSVVIDGSIGDADMTGINVIYITRAFDSLVIRYNSGLNCGYIGDGYKMSYYLFLMQGGTHDLAVYNNIWHSVMGRQQMGQLEARSNNIQVVHNTILPVDGGKRGIAFSGGIASDPYTHTGIMIRNNIMASIGESTGGHPSGVGPISGGAKSVVLGPNLLTDPTSNFLDRDGNITGDPVLSADLVPEEGSPALGMAEESDLRFDFNGVPRIAADMGAITTDMVSVPRDKLKKMAGQITDWTAN